MAEGKRKEVAKALEKCKAQLRAYVEHPFHMVKNLFRHRKVRYRGLAKNTAQLHTVFALANWIIAKPALTEETRWKTTPDAAANVLKKPGENPSGAAN